MEKEDAYLNMSQTQEEKGNDCETANESMPDSVPKESVGIVDESQELVVVVDKSQEEIEATVGEPRPVLDFLNHMKQLKSIKLKEIKPKDMDKDEWNKMDELALSTIMLTLAKSVYFNIADQVLAYDAWTKLSGFYEKQSAASQIYWLKKLVDLKMKEGTPISNHLNEFNTIYSQLPAQSVRFDEPVRAMFLLITLPESWDTFCTALSNSAPPDGLTIAGVEGSLLIEETNMKTMDKGKEIALVVRGRVNFRKKGEKRNQC
ncbi:hypothetical protein L7F22_006304 [Adiantum nelumboides]|nr:hypothetical protein [Adiantum nelumboides]